jgi:flagellar basal body-associated protein FliL
MKLTGFAAILAVCLYAPSAQAAKENGYYTKPTTFIVNLPESTGFVEFRLHIGVNDNKAISVLVGGNVLIVDRVNQLLWTRSRAQLVDPRIRTQLLKDITGAVKAAVKELGGDPRNITYVVFESYKVLE